jgi:hypothetical protein
MPTKTTQQPRYDHEFALGNRAFPAPQTRKKRLETKGFTPITEKPPQFTTKTKELFYPQRDGPSSAIDFYLFRKDLGPD